MVDNSANQHDAFIFDSLQKYKKFSHQKQSKKFLAIIMNNKSWTFSQITANHWLILLGSLCLLVELSLCHKPNI